MKHSIFDNTDADNGKQIETKNARNGGYLVGRSHKEGGIKGVNVDTGEPIEVEGGEVVITKPAVESKKTYTLNGKKMKPKEILSKLNSDHGGVAFAQGGQVGGEKFLLGGVTESGVEEYYKKKFGDKALVRISDDDLRSNVVKFEGVDYGITLNCRELDTNDEVAIESINVITAGRGDIIYLKSLKIMERFLSSLNPNVNYDLCEVPFVLKEAYYDSEKYWTDLELEREYTDSDGQSRTEIFLWNRQLYGFSNDSVVAIPKINEEILQEIIHPDDYQEYQNQNQQDFLNGKYVFKTDLRGALAQLCIYGFSSHTSNRVFLRDYHNGDFYDVRLRTGTNRYVENDVISVGDTCKITYSLKNCVNNVQFESEGMKYQALKNEGIYIIPYASTEEDAVTNSLNFSTTDEDFSDTRGRIYWVKTEIGKLSQRETADFETREYKIIGFILRKLVTGQIEQGKYNYILVLDETTGEKKIIYNPKIDEIIEWAQREYFGQLNTTQSAEDLAVRKVKKKDVRDAQLYEILLEGLSQEEARLIVMKGLISSSDKLKNLNIDRRLNEIATLKAQYKLDSQTALNLLDQFETMFYVEKSSRESKSGDVSINGQPSELTPSQYERVRSPEFIDWFGDWMTAYELDDYTGVSKIMNPRTAEPMVLFHGTDVDFTAWKFNQFPAAYFGDNRSYSEWFANLKSQGGEGHMYECFINIKNPIDLRQYGLENHKMGDILNYLEEKYDLNPRDIVPELNRLNPEQFDQVMEVNMKAWQFVRRGVPFLNYVKENTFYDGILMFEDNPQDIITTTVNGEQVQVPNTTGSFVVFREGQIKWAGATYFNSIISDNRFAKGGKIKSLAKKYKEMDFVF
jgi:hypothetical protein